MMTEKRQKYALCCQMEHRVYFHDAILPARCVASKQPYGLMATSQSYNAYFWAVWVLSRPNLGHQPEFRPEKCQVAIPGEALIPQTSRMRAFPTWVNQAGAVRGHSRRLYTKLGVHTRDELQAMLGI